MTTRCPTCGALLDASWSAGHGSWCPARQQPAADPGRLDRAATHLAATGALLEACRARLDQLVGELEPKWLPGATWEREHSTTDPKEETPK